VKKILGWIQECLSGWLHEASPELALRKYPERVARIEFTLLKPDVPGEYGCASMRHEVLQYICSVHDAGGECLYYKISDLGPVLYGYEDESQTARTMAEARELVEYRAKYWRAQAPERVAIIANGKEISW
jgi:hypothetical protein